MTSDTLISGDYIEIVRLSRTIMYNYNDNKIVF